MNVRFGLASQDLKEGWRKRQEGLVSHRFKGFLFLQERHRSEVLPVVNTYAQAALVQYVSYSLFMSPLRKGNGEEHSGTSFT